MSKIYSFKRLSDGAIFTALGTNSPIYENRREGNNDNAMHFYQLMRIPTSIESVMNHSGVYRVGERHSDGRVIALYSFSNQGELLAHLREELVETDTLIDMRHLTEIRADDLRVYIAPVAAQTPVIATVPAASYAGGTIRIIQNAIIRNNVRPIRIGDNNEFTSGVRIAKVRRESIAEFLEKFFINWNITRDTVYNDDGSVQTVRNKRRSIGDIYAICRWYYPTCTLKEVANALYNELPDAIESGFRSSYCRTIHKRVWYYIAGEEALMANEDRDDETGHNVNWWMDQLN